MKTKTLSQPFLLALALLGTLGAADVSHAEESWKTTLNRELPIMGYHNWIVIADAAYPWQAAPGIETIVTGADQLSVAQTVFEALGKTKHARPLVYTDAELPYVSENDAPSITAYRQELGKIMAPREAQSLPHEQLIGTIAQAGQTFHVLLLKTKGTLPYSSVFVQLDAAYWNPEAEQRLRAAMPSSGPAGGAANFGAPFFDRGGGPGGGPPPRFPPRPPGQRGGGFGGGR